MLLTVAEIIIVYGEGLTKSSGAELQQGRKLGAVQNFKMAGVWPGMAEGKTGERLRQDLEGKFCFKLHVRNLKPAAMDSYKNHFSFFSLLTPKK